MYNFMLYVCYTLYIYSRYWAESINNNWLHNVSAYIGLGLTVNLSTAHTSLLWVCWRSIHGWNILQSVGIDWFCYVCIVRTICSSRYHFYICCTSLLAVAMRTLDTRLKQEGTPPMTYLRLWQGLSWPTPLWVETPSVEFVISVCITYMACCKSWTMISALRVLWLWSKLVSPSHTHSVYVDRNIRCSFVFSGVRWLDMPMS